MRRITLKIAVGILAVVVGVIAVTVWFIAPFSLNSTLEIAPIANSESEMTEEYTVYSVVINDLFIKDIQPANFLHILNQTSLYEGVGHPNRKTSEQRIEHLKKSYPTVNEETLFDYEAKQTQTFKLYPRFNLPIEYILINVKELEKRGDSPHYGTIRLSKVGFNKQMSQAFVYVEYLCILCGGGNHFLLEKENGVWIIKEKFAAWAS